MKIWLRYARMSHQCIARWVVALVIVLVNTALAQRQIEMLGRGVVAVRQADGKAFVSWRMLGTDPDDVAFNVYRGAEAGEPKKLNDQPLKTASHFIDPSPEAGQANNYLVRPVLNGQEQPASAPFTLQPNASHPYLTLPVQPPAGSAPGDCSAADLDGDGEYDLVVHMTGRGRDNSQKGLTDPPILQGYKLDGTLLWTINLGRNIREGAHYTQFMVYDLDGDGRAEVVCKTSDGTTDGKGTVIGDANANHVNEAGHVLKGPEFLTVFDGRTGAALATEKYVPARTKENPENPDHDEYRELWRDNYGNRGERYLACIAYLDGQRPSVVMCRGYYERTTLAACDFRDGKLTQRWLFDTGPDRKNPYFGQGNHNLSVADVDDDGSDDIVYGGCEIDDNGKGLFSTEYGHGDAMHVSDFDPSNPGLEMFRIQERFGDAGAHMVALKTGKTLWKKPSVKAASEGGDKGEGPGRGACFNIDPRHPGGESWTAGAGIEGLWNAKGEEIGRVKPSSCNFRVFWDGDLLDELLDRNHISKWNWEKQTTERLLTAEGCASNNGTKATPCLSADILGDWREEVIWRTEDNASLRIYTSTIPTNHRLPT